MTTVTLGAFLRAADMDFERAASRNTATREAAGTLLQLRRITRSLTRYLDSARHPSTTTDSNIARLRRALAIADAFLDEAHALAIAWSSGAPSTRLRTLCKATDALAAGADLLATHTANNTGGRVVDRSGWASLLRTRPFADAVTAEISHWAEKLAAMCAGLARTRGLAASRAATYLTAAADTFQTASLAVVDATADIREDVCHLLYALPAASPPQRRPPTDAESVTDLCEGIFISATRLKAAAFTMPLEANWSGNISAPAWRRTSQLATSASDLALRAVGKVLADEQDPNLRVAAVTLDNACEAWRHTTGVWQVTTTDTSSPDSPAGLEAADLVQRLGRLISDPDNGWGFMQVLSVIHYTMDAFARMAITDLQVINRFGSLQRFYTPMSHQGRAHTYALATAEQVSLLIDAYQHTAQASSRAAEVLDDLVVHHNGPSKPLAIARKALLHDPDRTRSSRRTAVQLARADVPGVYVPAVAAIESPSRPTRDKTNQRRLTAM